MTRFASLSRFRIRLHEEDHFKAFLGWTLISAIYIGVSMLARGVSHKLPMILYGFSLVMIFIYTLLVEMNPRDDCLNRSGKRYRIWGLLFLVLWLVSITVLFGLFLAECYGTYGTGFENASDEVLPFIGFAWDNLTDVVFLGIFNVYSSNASGIRATTFATQTLVILFKLFVGMLVVKFIVSYTRLLKGQGAFSKVPFVSREP